jgi:hypothetical protein
MASWSAARSWRSASLTARRRGTARDIDGQHDLRSSSECGERHQACTQHARVPNARGLRGPNAPPEGRQHGTAVRAGLRAQECARRDLNPHVLADTGT